MKPSQSRNISNANFGTDVSQRNVYIASQGIVTGDRNVVGDGNTVRANNPIEIDKEVANLLSWLAEQQGISPELALKKAVATAAYIHDVTTGQGGKLLVKRKDNSVGEIVLR